MNNIELYIDKLHPEGWGLASYTRQDGYVHNVVVPNALPAETVIADLYYTKSKKTRTEEGKSLLGELSEVVKPSPLRVQPQCKHFAICGGCTWQHMPYREQLKIKEEHLKALFLDVAGPETKIFPIIASPQEYGYRNKMEFSFSEDTKGQKFLGLIMRCSRGRVFTIEECPLTSSWISKTLQAVYAWWQTTALLAYYGPKDKGHVRYLTMREAHTTHDRVIILTVSGNPDYAIKRSILDEFVKICKEHATPEGDATLTIVLRIQQVHKGRETQFFEMLLLGPDSFKERLRIHDKTLEFCLSPSSFFQPNSLQASRIYERALELAELKSDAVLYDLYAGVGIFGMCMASRVKEVIAIEISADSAYDAKVNSDRMKIPNFRIIRADVAKALEDKSLPKADAVVVDPPRTGLGKIAIKHIVALAPKTIIYVSCNPKTQKIDLEDLLQAGYKVRAIQPIDQFPQTIHVENIVILSLNV